MPSGEATNENANTGDNAGSSDPIGNLLASLGFATAGAALAALNARLKKQGSGKTASLAQNGIYVPVPRRETYTTTVGEWVTRPVRTMVRVARWVWKDITRLVPNIVTRVRNIVERIRHSKWVTTTRRVLKTFWERVTKRVPILGWLGRVIGWFWKTVVAPVRRWVIERVRKLYTWVETKVRQVTERVQDGWKAITERVHRRITEWVEKIDWVREWVTKEITRTRTVWERKFIPFGGGKIASPTRSLLLQLGAILGISLSMLSLFSGSNASDCGCKPCPPTATPNFAVTTTAMQSTADACAWQNAYASQTAVAATQTAMAGTPTSTPCLVTNKDQLNTDWGYGANENLYNQEILIASNSSGVPAWVLKGLIAAESSFNPIAHSSSDAYGLTQITGSGMGFLFGKNEDIAKTEIPNVWKLMTPDEQAQFPPLPSNGKSWRQWYFNLNPYTQKPIMQKYMLSSIDGKCTSADVPTRCTADEAATGAINKAEIQTNVNYGALILNYSSEEIGGVATANNINWASLPRDVQWGIAIANYNLSAGSGEAGQYIGPALQSCAGDLSWSCMSTKLTEAGAHLTPDYADTAINYAQQGCMP